jgi:epoxyqueuosine reductase
MNWETELSNFADKAQASLVGATRLTTPLTWSYYSQWLAQGFHADMNYMVDHAPLKQDPKKFHAHLNSAFVFAFDYVNHPKSHLPFPGSRTALYAQGEDYHFWLKDKLSPVVDQLQKIFPHETFYIHTDSGPVLERDLAYRAGLGWFGKNTCLISRKKGSLFLIGEIFTSLQVDLQNPLISDFCGTCQKCMEICPTQALSSPHVLDANRCISYWTIESRKIPPPEIRKKMGDWLFGCDLCQTVCPWNQKIYKTQLELSEKRSLSQQDRENLLQDLKFILVSSNRQIVKKIEKTPLMRAGPKGLKRNALIVIGNQKLVELKTLVEEKIQDPFLGSLAKEILMELENPILKT